MTLPNYLDAKKPSKSHKYKPPAYSSRPSNSYGSGLSSVHGHDFKPFRGGSGSYSYSAGLPPRKHFDDYHDGPSSSPYHDRLSSPYHHYPTSSSDGPKSYVSMSTNLNDDDSDGVIAIDHGRGGDEEDASDNYRHQSDPLHPLRGYHASDHDHDHDMYARLRQEYQKKSGKSSLSPYFQQHGDYNYEPSSVYSRRHEASSDDDGDDGADEGDGKSPRKKAYWRMSFVQKA